MHVKHVWFLLAAAVSLVEIQCVPVSAPGQAFRLSLDQKHAGSLSVGCTVDASLTSMKSVTALTLYGSRPYGKPDQFDPLASLDLWSPQARLLTGLRESDGVEVTGSLAAGGDDTTSCLEISWTSPLNALPRYYRCDVNGLDTVGHTVTLSMTTDSHPYRSDSTDVESKDNQRQVGESQLETRFLNLSSGLDEVRDALRSVVDLLENQTSTLAQNQARIVSQLRLTGAASLSDGFHISRVFQGKRYLATKTADRFVIDVADFQCGLLGGYLVEIDHKEEYDFVFDFVKSLGGDNFFTGGNDLQKEGTWTNWRSGQAVGYPNWYPGQPNDHNNNEDCMEIRVSFGSSNDLHCDAQAKFVCEIPA